MRRPKRLFAFAVALLIAVPVCAQEWSGLVIGQTAPTAPTAFADAFHVNKALKDAGIGQVDMLRDQPRSAVLAEIARLTDTSSAVIYISAPLTQNGKGLVLEGGTLSFETLLAEASKAGVSQLALMVENCPGPAGSIDVRLPKADMPMLTAFSAGPGEVCPLNGERLTDVLRQDIVVPVRLDRLVQDVWVSSDLEALPLLRPAEQSSAPVVTVMGARPVPAVETVVSRASVSMLAPLTLAPVSAQPDPSTASPARAVNLAPAQPVAEGLPRPSIIVGILPDATLASFSPAVKSGDVAGNEISYENLSARQTLQEQDPALFATLVESGAFDPPADLMAAALQTELARMGCYNSGIDGIWGSGSRGSVQRYFEQRQAAEPVSLDPEAGLFRQVILGEDVRCPVVAAARRSSAPAARTTSSRRTTTPTVAPQRQQQTSTRTISNSNRLGVFR